MLALLASALAQSAPSIYAFSHLAGPLGGMGNADGPRQDARFDNPTGGAVDNMGNVYVADTMNRTIRKISSSGMVTTLAGGEDGAGGALEIYFTGVAVDSAGNVYDSNNNTIRRITPAGLVTVLAGTAGVPGNADGIGAAAQFNDPGGVAVDDAGNVYIADSGNNTIRRITPGGEVTTIAGTAGVSGSADGVGAAAQFYLPSGVALDGVGNIYVSDGFNDTIRKITPNGEVSTLAGTPGVEGSADGVGAAAQFGYLTGLALDSAGNIYVADDGNRTIRKITPSGMVTTLAGTPGVDGSADGVGAAAQFNFPVGVAVDNAGNVYVTDWQNCTIRKITPAGLVTTFAGMAALGGFADGTGTAAEFFLPAGVAIDSAGTAYVADQGNNARRKVTPYGVVTTLAGGNFLSGSADGTGSAAQFNNPNAVAVDNTGNIYVADRGNGTIRKVSPAGVVTTFAGTAGVFGDADGTGASA